MARGVGDRAGPVLLLLLLAACGVQAMFSKTSDVDQLTSKTLPKYLNSHKPVMLLLYAPWCGHCKAIHPEWDQLATSLKGIVKVAAVDASADQDVARQYGVQGFPTVKMFGMNTPANKGKARSALDYNQARKFGAMKSAALGLINQGYVKAYPADGTAVESPNVVLFTKKDKTPPIYSVAAASPKLSQYTFYKVQEGKKAAKQFDSVPSWPSVGVFSADAEPRWLELSDGKAKYETVAKFIAGDAATGAAADAGETDTDQQEKKPASKGPSMASGTIMLSSFSLGRCQKGVLCVFHHGPQENVVNIKEKKVIFFTVEISPSRRNEISKLADALNLEVPEGSTLVIRPTNAEGTAVKYLVSSKDVQDVVGSAVNGDLPFKKLDLSETPLAKLLG